jgi:uncharacterized membrane protein YedE/YeeE
MRATRQATRRATRTAAGARAARRRALALLFAGLAGALFGAGLLVSGMTRPARVLAFLGGAGPWDPSLAFVMGTAVVVYAAAHRWIRRSGSLPWFGAGLHLPTRRDLDLPLIVGAALFGIGWGLGGLCPGPAIVSAAAGELPALAFVAAMLAGMYAHQRSKR